MGNTPFSVVMSVYKNDRAEFFDRALESITVKQTVKPSEIVLIVDGYIDSELDAVIEKYEGIFDGLRVIRLEKNGGLGNALKIGVEKAGNQIIARMDSDDVALPNRFEQQLKFFETPDVDMVGGDITEFIDDETNIVGKRAVPCGDTEIKEYMKKRCPFNHMTVMYKKDAVLKAGGYLDWFWNEDYYLWLRMMLSGAVFANTGTVLVNVRVGADMYKRRGGIKYFKSEARLQKFMLKNKIINWPVFAINTAKRFMVQVLLPNGIRGWVFKKFARQKI